MKAYEYIRLEADMGDLSTLNNLSSMGWHVVAVLNDYLLLEREVSNVRQA